MERNPEYIIDADSVHLAIGILVFIRDGITPPKRDVERAIDELSHRSRKYDPTLERDSGDMLIEAINKSEVTNSATVSIGFIRNKLTQFRNQGGG